MAPRTQARTIDAIGMNQTISKVACDFLYCLWTQLKKEVSDEEFYRKTAKWMVCALAHNDHGVRERISEVSFDRGSSQ